MQNDPTYDETLLLRRVAMGDEEVFADLYHRYKLRLYGFILRLTQSRETAEDVVQDVFLKIWSTRAELERVDNFSGYLFRMAQNHSINGLRRMARGIAILGELKDDQPSVVEDTSGPLLLKDLQQQLQAAIEKLPPQQRAVYLLGRVQGLKHEEIARQLDISPSTVKNHMLLAVSNLRKQLASSYPSATAVFLVMAKIIFDRVG